MPVVDDSYVVAGGVEGDSPNGTTAVNVGLVDPSSVTFDGSGNLIIVDTGNNRVIEDPAATNTWFGVPMTKFEIYDIVGNQAGSPGHTGDGGAGYSSYLSLPNFVDFQSNNLYVADTDNNRIQEMPWSTVTQWGEQLTKNDVYTVAGSSSGAGGYSGNGGNARSAEMSYPSGLRIDASGDLDISDTDNNVVRQVNVSTYDISTIAGDLANGVGTVGDVYFATQAGLAGPGQVAVDSAGNVYIADTFNNRVQEIAATSHTQWGTPMTAGYVYTIAGKSNGAEGYTGSGLASSSSLDEPEGVAVDAEGDLLIAESGSCVVQEVSASTYDISTIAGKDAVLPATGNGGPATSAELTSPYGLALDAAGDIVIADAGSNEVRVVANGASHTEWGVSMPTAGDIY